MNLKALLSSLVALAAPDLRASYRALRKGRIVRTYASGGVYWADVQPCRNDGSDDPTEPVIPQVELPVIWGGPGRGIVCPPAANSRCDLEYYDGDPNYPRISNIRWEGSGAPVAAPGELVIHQGATGTHIILDAAGNVTVVTSGTVTVDAPQSHITGSVTIDGSLDVGLGIAFGTQGAGGSMTGNGSISVTGSINADGAILAGGANSNHHTHP